LKTFCRKRSKRKANEGMKETYMNAQGTKDAHEAEDHPQVRHKIGDELEECGNHNLVPLD